MNKIFSEKNITIGLLICCFLSLFLKNSINSICLVLLVVYSLINYFLIKKRKIVLTFGFRKEEIYFIIYFLVIVISVIYSENKDVAIKHIGRYIAFLVVPLSFNFLPVLSHTYKFFIRKVYVYGIIVLLTFLFFNAVRQNAEIGYSFIDFISSIFLSIFDSDVTVSGIEYWVFMYEGLTGVINIQPIYISLFVNLGYAFLISLREKEEISSVRFWAISAFFLLFSVLLSSRMETIIFFVLLFLYLLVYSPKSKKEFFRNLFACSISVFLMVLVVFSNPILKDRILSTIDTNYTSDYVSFANQNVRMEKWKNSLQVIEKSPIIGQGIGDYKDELIAQYKENNFLLGVENRYNSHNQYLDTMLQSGLFGLVVLLGLFFRGVINAYKKDLEKILLYLTFGLSFITESMFDRHWGIVSFVFFVCFSLKYTVDINNNK